MHNKEIYSQAFFRCTTVIFWTKDRFPQEQLVNTYYSYKAILKRLITHTKSPLFPQSLIFFKHILIII